MCCSNSHHNQGQDSFDLVNTSYGDDGWCNCPGEYNMGCCGYATQEDGKCDRCRKHCQTVAHHGRPAEVSEPAIYDAPYEKQLHLPLVGQDILFPDRNVEVAAVS